MARVAREPSDGGVALERFSLLYDEARRAVDHDAAVLKARKAAEGMLKAHPRTRVGRTSGC